MRGLRVVLVVAFAASTVACLDDPTFDTSETTVDPSQTPPTASVAPAPPPPPVPKKEKDSSKDKGKEDD
jgi:hypothetical protein